jgi:hypothetical protein
LFAIPESEDTEVFANRGGGTFQFGQHIDGANTLDERDRSAEGSGKVTEEQGHETPIDPALQAEGFVSLRDMLYMKYLDECNKARRKPLDQSFASVINWMYSREFQPNNAEAQAVWAASKGRVSIDQAIAAQKKRFEDEKSRLAKVAEPLLKTLEDMNGLDLGEFLQTDTPSHEDGDVVIDKLFESQPALVRLGIVNVMWRRHTDSSTRTSRPSACRPTTSLATSHWPSPARTSSWPSRQRCTTPATTNTWRVSLAACRPTPSSTPSKPTRKPRPKPKQARKVRWPVPLPLARLNPCAFASTEKSVGAFFCIGDTSVFARRILVLMLVAICASAVLIHISGCAALDAQGLVLSGYTCSAPCTIKFGPGSPEMEQSKKDLLDPKFNKMVEDALDWRNRP